VKADFDEIEEFLGLSSRFFERLSIVEGKCDSGPLGIAIVRVFSAQLVVYAIVDDAMSRKRVHISTSLHEHVSWQLTSGREVLRSSMEHKRPGADFSVCRDASRCR
jgi:hypothetical protein